MSETKFTKGEWKVYEYNKHHWNNPDLPHVTIHYGDNEEHIVDTVYELADAHLIAAAPKMYEMIENLSDLDEMQMFKSEINELLAEARGEQC